MPTEGVRPNKNYGEAVNDPMKFCKISMSAGKGDRNRVSDYEKYRNNYDLISGPKPGGD
jgi:hypothetical protein